MNQHVIITNVRHQRTYTGRDGIERYALEVEFKVPFSGKEGQLCYDNYIGSYSTDSTQRAFDEVAALCGREAQIVCYFNIEPWKKPDGTIRYFQKCNIRSIHPREYAPKS